MSRDKQRPCFRYSRERFPGSESRSRSRSRDRGSSDLVTGGDWDWKRRPQRDFSPPRHHPPFHGGWTGRSSPRGGRGSPIRPPGFRFLTRRVFFHDDQVGDRLMADKNKLLSNIKQKFPGVSRIDLGLKNEIEISGSPGAVKVKWKAITLTRISI